MVIEEMLSFSGEEMNSQNDHEGQRRGSSSPEQDIGKDSGGSNTRKLNARRKVASVPKDPPDNADPKENRM
jgi:hypothetical protein